MNTINQNAKQNAKYDTQVVRRVVKQSQNRNHK